MPVSAAELQRTASMKLPLPRFAGLPHPSGWTLTAEDRTKYEGIFPKYAGSNGRLAFTEGVELLGKSGLDSQTVKKIWELADTDKDSHLTMAEFCLAMHITGSCAKRGMVLPPFLPISLAAAVGVPLPGSGGGGSGGGGGAAEQAAAEKNLESSEGGTGVGKGNKQVEEEEEEETVVEMEGKVEEEVVVEEESAVVDLVGPLVAPATEILVAIAKFEQLMDEVCS